MKKFETERLEIREFEDNDIGNLCLLLSDSEVMEYCSGSLDYVQSQRWLDSILKLEKIYATVEKDNSVSKKVLEKIGMEYTREAICFNKKIDLYSF